MKEIRRTNFRQLVAQYDTQRAFADAAGMNREHVSHLVTGHRNIGETVARQIEQRFELPYGWLDHSHAAGVADDRGEYRARILLDTQRITDDDMRQKVDQLIDAIANGKISPQRLDAALRLLMED